MNKKEDIINGLLSLMNRYQYSLITVTQIVQEANLGRKTFYRYFKNKDEVLEETVKLLFLEYSKFQKNYYSTKYEILIYNHFLFWKKHLEFLNLLYKNELMLFVFKQYQKYIPQLNHSYLTSKNINTTTSLYANSFSIGIFWSMLYTWVENGAKESPKELANLCFKLFQNKVNEDEWKKAYSVYIINKCK